jgi:N-methylhydantoinase A
VVDDQGFVNVFKALTTPIDRVQGVINGLKIAAEHYQMSLESIMASCTFFSHGTTTATNALIERKTAKVGLICTKGHRDILLFREGAKEDPFNWDLDYPEPFVPRYLTLPVSERITAEGQIYLPLDEKEVREIIRRFRLYNVEAIAVSLMWSIANPIHEKRIGEIIKEEWPEIDYALSHEVNPSIREYRRTVCTVIDASLKPLVGNYVNHFEKNLREIGYNNQLFLLTSSGGMASPEEMVKKPLYIIDSGPALGPVAGRFYAESELGAKRVITCDMGGTSFDVSRVTDGTISITRDVRIGEEKLNIAKVDSKSIGAGGGSIAWVDKGRLLHVGPQGAGSEPGPACYRRGGKNATVTDANVVLGYLDADYFLGGMMKLEKSLAEEAILENVSKPLGLSLIEGAHAIWNTVCVNMTEAIRDITVWEGIDPREYVFVSGGGASGMHIVPIVSSLGGKQVIIPKTAAGLSAFGGLIADVVRELQWSHFSPTNNFDYDGVNQVLHRLEFDSRAFLNSAGIPQERQRIEYLVEARYPFQERELAVPIKSNTLNEDSVAKLVSDFHDTHDRVLGSKDPSQYIECVMWRARAIGLIPPLSFREREFGDEHPPTSAFKGKRMAYFKELNGLINTPVYEGDELKANNRINGPAIIEEKTTTIVLFQNSSVLVSRFGNYLIEIG